MWYKLKFRKFSHISGALPLSFYIGDEFKSSLYDFDCPSPIFIKFNYSSHGIFNKFNAGILKVFWDSAFGVGKDLSDELPLWDFEDLDWCFLESTPESS